MTAEGGMTAMMNDVKQEEFTSDHESIVSEMTQQTTAEATTTTTVKTTKQAEDVNGMSLESLMVWLGEEMMRITKEGKMTICELEKEAEELKKRVKTESTEADGLVVTRQKELDRLKSALQVFYSSINS